MTASPTASGVTPELIQIRRESSRYSGNKPGEVPPADSPTRPALARLWRAAHATVTTRPNARTFSYAGWRFGVVYADGRLYVFDWQTRVMLVRPPASLQALHLALINAQYEL